MGILDTLTQCNHNPKTPQTKLSHQHTLVDLNKNKTLHSSTKWVTAQRHTTRPKKAVTPSFIDANRFAALANIDDESPPVLKSGPQVVINKNPDAQSSWPKTLPGNSTYANTVKDGKHVMIYSDSICNTMSKWELNRKAKAAELNCQINKKPFVGATSEDIHSYHMIPTLKSNTPDEVIIHAGINDTRQLADSDGGMSSEVINLIAKNVIECGKVAQSYGVNSVCISALLPTRGKKYQQTIEHINYQIGNLCKREGFNFISNDNIKFIDPTPLDEGLHYKDGLHLNVHGRQILMDNFIFYLSTL